MNCSLLAVRILATVLLLFLYSLSSPLLKAQRDFIQVGLNYGFQNFNKTSFNNFFTSFNNQFTSNQLATPARMLNTTSFHGIGAVAGLGILGGRDEVGGFVNLLNYEYNYAGWKNKAVFTNKIEQDFVFRMHAHKIYTEFGADLKFFFFSFLTGIQVNKIKLRVFNTYPTGNISMSQDNSLNGIYTTPGAGVVTVPLGLRGGIVIKRRIRIPVSFEYNLPLFGSKALLLDRLYKDEDTYFPEKYKPFPLGSPIEQRSLKGWTLRFGVTLNIFLNDK